MKNKKCAIYIRTNREGVDSIKNQISLLEIHMKHEGMELYNIYLDISNASNFNRPVLHKIFEDAHQKKFEVILVKDLTRIARNVEYIRQCLNFLNSIDVKLITTDNVKEPITTL